MKPFEVEQRLEIARAGRIAVEHGREIGVVLEVKHATYFSAIGLDLAPLIAQDLRAGGWADGELPLVVEAFESTVLAQLRDAGIAASFIYLIEASGKPFDLVSTRGRAAPDYASAVTADGLDGLRGEVDGISVTKRMLLQPGNTIVADAHARGLKVFTWTCRPENTFLSSPFRASGGKSAFGDYEAEWRVIADAGVDGVFVDHPDLGVAFFG
jgi:glycerophosphoryl diester phosphodiesterase